MLERVSLNQTRFNVPGISPDPRGVVLGQRAVVLLPTIERLVSFFRVYGDQESIDELLPTLRICQVKTRLATREFVASFAAASSYKMDRVAAISRMLGGMVFTGTSRHFVKYRDAASPLGYDADRLLATGGDIALYHDHFSEAYEEDREVSLAQLVLRLTPQRIAAALEEESDSLTLAVRTGIAGAVQGYLFRNGVEAEAAMVEWRDESAFDEGDRRLLIVRCPNLPPRIVALMDATPGIEVYVPLGPNFAVQKGYRHPIHLPSCASIFSGESLYLFSGSRGRVDVISPAPEFIGIRQLCGVDIDLGEPQTREAVAVRAEGDIRVGLRLVPSSSPWRKVVGVSVPWARVDWLRRLVYAMPPRFLENARMHRGAERIVVLNDEGIDSIPIGTFLYRFGPSVLVAAGYDFLPAVSPELLGELLEAEAGSTWVFEPGLDGPYVIRDSELTPVGRAAIAAPAGRLAEAIEPEAPEPVAPQVQYDDIGPFPLWGLPGARRTGGGR